MVLTTTNKLWYVSLNVGGESLLDGLDLNKDNNSCNLVLLNNIFEVFQEIPGNIGISNSQFIHDKNMTHFGWLTSTKTPCMINIYNIIVGCGIYYGTIDNESTTIEKAGLIPYPAKEEIINWFKLNDKTYSNSDRIHIDKFPIKLAISKIHLFTLWSLNNVEYLISQSRINNNIVGIVKFYVIKFLSITHIFA